MKKTIQPETYWPLWACLGVCFVLTTGRLMASPLLPADTCQTPAAPSLRSSTSAICRGDVVHLTATGCAGSVIWSTGERGPQIDVRPLRTVRYTAICRSAAGCVSCFADPIQLTVKTPASPTVVASSPVLCPGESVTLTATNCTGIVRWPDSSTGVTWVITPNQTATFQATSETDGCVSNLSTPVQVQVSYPQTPTIFVDKPATCAGQSVQLTAAGCVGSVRWSDGGVGSTRQVKLSRTTTFRAICVAGTCRSDSSSAVQVRITSPTQSPALLTSVSNGCPFQTADLTRAITESRANRQAWYEFKTKPDPNAPAVQTATAVGSGTYYVFERAASGCYSEPVAVLVAILPCANAIAPCLSSPAVVTAQLDTLDRAKGIVRLSGQLHGSAGWGHWQSDGTGLFTDTTITLARYIASEGDIQHGSLTFTLSTNDPDGPGPCTASSASLTVSVSPSTTIVQGENGNPANPDIPVIESPETTIVFIPEGFSPNNDGVNDRFVIQQMGQPAGVSLAVFNRWGQLVYQSDPYKNDWDGTANRGIRAGLAGQGLPDGTYFYAVRLSDGREFTRFLTLAR